MTVRTAETVFAGNPTSLIAAADRAAKSMSGAASRMRAAAGQIETAYTRTGAAATAAGDVAAKAAAKSGASIEAQAKAAGTAAARQAESVKASAGVQARAYASAADAARASAIRTEAAAVTTRGSWLSMSGAGKKAASEISSSGGIIGKSFGTISSSGNVAIAALAAVGAAAYGVKKAADTTAELAKETLTLHNVTGLSIKSASAYASVAKVQGIEAKALNTSFGTLAKNAQAVINAHDGLTKSAHAQVNAFWRLGISAHTLVKDHGDMNLVMAQVTAKFEAMRPSVTKTAIGMALFGKGWQSLVPLMHKGMLGLQENLEMARKMGATLGGVSVKNLKQFEEAQEKAKYATLGLQLAIGQYLAPALTKVITFVANAVDSIRTLSPPVKIALETVAGLITTVLGGAIGGFLAVKVVAFVKGISTMVGAVVGLGKKMLVTVGIMQGAETTMVADSRVAAAGVDASLMGTGIGATLVALGGAAFLLKEHWSEVMKWLEKATQDAANAIIEALNKVKKIIEEVTGSLGGDIKKVKIGGGGGIASEVSKIGEESAKHGAFKKGNPVAAAALKYKIPESVLMEVFGKETSYGKNVTTSSAGAMGDFQFIPGTAKNYKYPMTNHPTSKQFAEQANAAAHYLADLIRQNNGNINAAMKQYSGGGYGYSGKPEATEGRGPKPNSGAVRKAAKAVKIEPYADPFRNATGVHRGETDQGVDFTFGGSLGAIGSGVIARIIQDPGGFGTEIVEKFTSGIHKGQYAYTGLETGATLATHVGAHVKAGQMIARGKGTGGIEMGFASGPGGVPITPYTSAAAHAKHLPTAGGEAFSKFLASIGKGGSGLQIATAEQSTREKAEAIARKAEEKRRTAHLKTGESQLHKLIGAIQTGGVKELSGVVGGKHDKWLAVLEKTLTKDGTKAGVSLEKHLVNVHTRALTHLATAIKTQWTEAMATVKKSMGELVKQSGEAWRTLQQIAIGKKHEDALKAIKAGPGAELTKMQKEDEAKAAAKEELKLNEELACAKREGNKKRQKETEEAITDFARQQDEKRKGESISVAEETADAEQKVAEEGLDAQTVAYEAMLANQLAALEAMLAKGELSWDAFKERVFGVTGITPEGSGPGKAPAAPPAEAPKGGGWPGKKWAGEPQPGWKARASGGPVYPGVTYKVGELGEETFTPAVAGHITPAGQGTSGSSAGVANHFYGDVNLGSRRDADRFANKLAFQLTYGGR